MIKTKKQFIIDSRTMNVQVATQQPPTTAKVILYTSHGEIDIQLWTKETPLASKNFIQHCIDGYYVDTIFHRLIPGFMIQGGDPTGTGMGGESIYGDPFKDEFHQRLKFSRRGIVAMANAGKNTNKSQFFITFGPCEHLNKKHTIIGKVVGDTIYNLMSLQSLDTGQQDRPIDPPVIRKIKVVENPFTDIKIQGQALVKEKQVKLQGEKQDEKNKDKVEKSKKQDLKKLKNKKKLTFQDEQQLDQGQTHKMISSHDVLYKKDASLSNKLSITKEQIEKKRKQKQVEQKKAQQIKHSLALNNLQEQQDHDVGENKNIAKMIQKQMNKKRAHFQKSGVNIQQKDQVLNYQKRFNPSTKKYQIVFKDELDRQRAQQQKQLQKQRKAKQQQQITDQKLKQVRQLQLQEYNLLKADELNFKRAKEGSLKERRKQIIEEEKKLLSNLEKHRYEYVKKQKMEQHQGELFKKLMDFSSRLKTVGKGNSTKKDNQNQQSAQRQADLLAATARNKKVGLKNTWMDHQLKFHIDSTNAYSLQEKSMKVNKNYQDEDDGGLKMEVQYNNYDEDSNDKELQKVLKQL